MEAKATQQQSAQSEQKAVQSQTQATASPMSDLPASAGVLLGLQHAHGNRFVQRFLNSAVLQRACACGGSCADCGQTAQAEEAEQAGVQRKAAALLPFIQAKLTVSQPGDAYEQEADRVADQVMRKIDGTGIQMSGHDRGTKIQRAKDSDTQEKNAASNPLIEQINAVFDQEGLQAKSQIDGISVSDGLESELASTKGSGQPIPDTVRAEMESAFGADFSSVRLHTDSQAVRMSRDVNAHAFTHGKDIYFNQGKFDPSSAGGKHLLAHELTHTIQQDGSEIRRLSITRHSRTPLDCGGRQVRWIFTLDNPAPADGYIVQRVRYLLTQENCPSNVSSISLTPTLEFWEAWEVNAGDTRHALHSHFGFTDMSARPPEPGKSGVQATLGTVKFFLRSVTGDLGRFATPPSTPGSSWAPGNGVSGSLPSTLSQPSWWNNTPTEGPARRWASSWWNCCGEESSHFSRIDSNP
jgi:uncharacterized protein DUF4157